METFDQRLAAIAGPQAGAFTVQQARDAGVPLNAILRRVRRGTIQKVHPRTYVFGHGMHSVETLRWAAVLAAGPRALTAGEAAAQDWKLSRGSTDPGPEIVVPHRRRALAGVRTTQSRTLHPEDVSSVGGRPTTTPERTLVDLAAVRTETQLRRMLREANVRGILDLDQLRRTIDRNANRPGIRRMRRALARFLEGDGGADGRKEARFVRMLIAAGETSAVCNKTL